MVGRLVGNWADIRVFNLDIKTLLNGQIVKFVVNIVRIGAVTLQTEDREPLEVLGLVHHRVQAAGVLQSARNVSGARRVLLGRLSIITLVASSSLLRKVGRFKYLRPFKYFGFDGIRLQFNLEAPLLDFFALGNHVIKLANGADAVVRLLEETLTHGSHGFLVVANLLGDAYEHAEFRREIDILALLLDFKQRLVQAHDLLVVLFAEVLYHRDRGAFLALFELASLGAHVVPHATDLVGFVVAVTRHHNCAFEFVINRFLNFGVLWRFSRVALAFFLETRHLFVN